MEDAVRSGDESAQDLSGVSDLAAAEEVVLLARRAIGASQAADEEYCDAHRHKDCKDITIHRKPMKQTVHSKGNPSIHVKPSVRV